MVKELLAHQRVPCEYFVTKGKGESDLTVHAGSFHFALLDAGIMEFNIITYSSVLPAIAKEIEKPDNLVFGSVMETIMAVATAEKNETATAGIIYGWLYYKKTKEKYGGIVCEYNGNLNEKEAEQELERILDKLYEASFAEEYELKEKRTIIESFVSEKKFGTALVALCFINYVYPLMGDD
ncbi:pyruvoyl-dependent arginine decarboxylase [Candidatus Micrarchaeota archaeon]|nr:pyruvoyl-dependent arginine decarboxylase [Candidatus Micrarchaeota archaeon]